VLNCTATTAKGKPCKRSALEGTDPPLCVSHLGGRVGRKTVLNAELTDRIAQMLRAGNYVEVACAAVGVNRCTFYDWYARGEEGVPGLYKDFRERVDQARAEGEARNVALVAKAASRTWQAAAWMLERQYPERWGRPSQRQEEPEAEAADGFAALDELAVRRRAS
jgi:hypothetical protein